MLLLFLRLENYCNLHRTHVPLYLQSLTPFKEHCQPGNAPPRSIPGIPLVCPRRAHCEHPHVLEWVIIPWKEKKKKRKKAVWSRRRRLREAFNAAWPSLARDYTQAVVRNDSAFDESLFLNLVITFSWGGLSDIWIMYQICDLRALSVRLMPPRASLMRDAL